MHDLKTQLSDYLDHAVVRVTVEDVLAERVGVEPVRPLRPRTPHPSSWRRRGWAVAAVVFVAVVLGGLAAGWLRGDTVTPPADTPVTTVAPVTTIPPITAAPETDAAPVTAAADVTDADVGTGPELQWGLVEGITWLEPGPAEVSYIDGEYVVLQLDAEGKSILASTSPDGVTWAEVSYPFPEGLVRTDWSSGGWGNHVTTELIVTVAESESGIVVAAIERNGGNVIEYPLPADVGVYSPVDRVLVAPDGSLLVAGGVRGWHSPDGQQWTEVLIDDTAGRVGNPVVEVNGALLLAGQFGEGNSIYRSVDGIEWVQIIEADIDLSTEVFAPWNGGVLMMAAGDSRDEIALVHLTEGAQELLSLPIDPLGVSDDPDDPFFSPLIGALTGDLGILVVNSQGTHLYSPDGIEWSTSTLPNNWGPEEATFIPGALGAVGSDSMLITVWIQDQGWRLVRGAPTSP